MDEDLQSMWQEINDTYFDGQLESLATIDWAPISGPEGIGAHGRYFHKSKCIVIDEKLKFSKDAIRSGDEAEGAKLEFADGLLIHEMVHQALHQKKASNPGGHGPSFLEEARRIAGQRGEELPTENDVKQWPLHRL